MGHCDPFCRALRQPHTPLAVTPFARALGGRAHRDTRAAKSTCDPGELETAAARHPILWLPLECAGEPRAAHAGWVAGPAAPPRRLVPRELAAETDEGALKTCSPPSTLSDRELLCEYARGVGGTRVVESYLAVIWLTPRLASSSRGPARAKRWRGVCSLTEWLLQSATADLGRWRRAPHEIRRRGDVVVGVILVGDEVPMSNSGVRSLPRGRVFEAAARNLWWACVSRTAAPASSVNMARCPAHRPWMRASRPGNGRTYTLPHALFRHVRQPPRPLKPARAC